ncbi:hypothetical protein EC968_005642 [Mortierella alpina]|nr:hypothetical protein EC968_005642 [Mortierella alpina]
MDAGTSKQKRLRPGTACKRCRTSKLRCSGAPGCDRCVARGIVCSIDVTQQQVGEADHDHNVIQQQPGLNPTISNSYSEQGSNASTSDTSTPRLLSSGTPESDTKVEELTSTLGIMSLDSRGEHFHRRGSGFAIMNVSSRSSDGRYAVPIVGLTDSDLRSHSLLSIWEEELPPRDVMDNLLHLYFQHIYPFAPLFVRKTFMRDYHEKPLDAHQITLLNAVFCNACVFSDNPTEIGLHRQDVYTYGSNQEVIRKRVWWALYIGDRISSASEGRPTCIRDSEFRVGLPSSSWVPTTMAKDPDESLYESELLISGRLLWTVKLATLLGKALHTMHSIEAETNDGHLEELSRTQLPLLHNKFMAWYMGLPAELLVMPYTTSYDPQYRPSPATALLQMLFYTSLIKLHMPLFCAGNSSSIDANVLTLSRNICTAAATNICHVADSLLLHGVLIDGSSYLFCCLLSAKMVFLHNAMTSSISSRKATTSGLFKILRASLELAKTYPFFELIPALMIDVLSCQNKTAPQDVEAIFYEISNFLELVMDSTQFQSTAHINMTARIAKVSKEWSGQAPSVEVHHPKGLFSMPLPDYTKDHQAEDMSSLWQDQIAKAVSLVIGALGGANPQLDQPRLYVDPLELPEDLRLAPIEEHLFGDISLPFETSP